MKCLYETLHFFISKGIEKGRKNRPESLCSFKENRLFFVTVIQNNSIVNQAQEALIIVLIVDVLDVKAILSDSVPVRENVILSTVVFAVGTVAVKRVQRNVFADFPNVDFRFPDVDLYNVTVFIVNSSLFLNVFDDDSYNCNACNKLDYACDNADNF